MLELLRTDFVVGWENNWREVHVGYSNGYSPNQSAVGTTNGAGGHNVQIFVLSPDGIVLHALPGFWHPEDLARELRFAKIVARLWEDPDKTREDKERMFRLLHIAELRRQPAETYARSAWQSFDQWAEFQKLRQDPDRDTAMFDEDGAMQTTPNGQPVLRPLNVLAHQRMVDQPFRPFEEFDVAAFVDYGRYFYDLNMGHDRGRHLPGQDRLRSHRARDAARAQRQRR